MGSVAGSIVGAVVSGLIAAIIGMGINWYTEDGRPRWATRARLLAIIVAGIVVGAVVAPAFDQGDLERSSPTSSPMPTPTTPSQASTSNERANRGELIVVRIVAGRSGKTGVDEYRSGVTPGFNIEVSTASGQVQSNDECFVDWVYSANGEAVSTANSSCGNSGFTDFSSGPLVPGDGVVEADVSTGWGASKHVEYRFTVVE